jgi:peroxiredoxin
MIRNIAISALLLCSFTGPTLIPSRAADFSSEKAAVGKTAPDFELKDINGKDVKLSDFRKKFVVLEWFNDGCPFVKKHYNGNNMQGLQKEYTKKGVVWLSICSSAAGQQGNHTNAEFKEILKKWDASPTHLLVDADGTVGHLYGAKTTPDMFVIGKDGELLYAGAIDDQPVPDPESLKIAKNYVREALDEALAGKAIATTVTKSYGCKVHYGG